MAREPSDLTKAYRELFREDPSITYVEALPLLQDKGFDLVDQKPFSNSAEQLRQKAKELDFDLKAPSRDLVKYLETVEEIEADGKRPTKTRVTDLLGWKAKRIDKVLAEHEQREKVFKGIDPRQRGKIEKELLERQRYEAEMNSFNVNKYIKKKHDPDHSTSKKPVPKVEAETSANPPPPARRRKSVPKSFEPMVKTANDALKKLIEEVGDYYEVRPVMVFMGKEPLKEGNDE